MTAARGMTGAGGALGIERLDGQQGSWTAGEGTAEGEANTSDPEIHSQW